MKGKLSYKPIKESIPSVKSYELWRLKPNLLPYWAISIAWWRFTMSSWHYYSLFPLVICTPHWKLSICCGFTNWSILTITWLARIPSFLLLLGGSWKCFLSIWRVLAYCLFFYTLTVLLHLHFNALIGVMILWEIALLPLPYCLHSRPSSRSFRPAIMLLHTYIKVYFLNLPLK